MKIRISEDEFLEARIGQPATIYLINGIKLNGILAGHDLEAVFMQLQDENSREIQMIFKQAISTILTLPASSKHPLGVNNF